MRPIPPWMTFRHALRAGYAPIRDRSYMDRVKELPCCACDQPADDPHHVYAQGYKGTGTKVPDVWVIPMCRLCHDELHEDVAAWERKHGTQWEHVCLTFAQLWHAQTIGMKEK